MFLILFLTLSDISISNTKVMMRNKLLTEMGCVRVKAESVKDGAREMVLANEAELSRITRQEQLVGLYLANYWEENCNKLLIFL